MSSKRKRKAKKAALRLAPDEDPEFQIAPMIDVLLVMLVFFMSISTAEILQNVKGIQLPIAADALTPKERPGQAVINIKYFPAFDSVETLIGETKIENLGELASRLQSAVITNPQIRVLIRADKNIEYEYIRDVMVQVGNARIGNITFSTVDKEGSELQSLERE